MLTFLYFCRVKHETPLHFAVHRKKMDLVKLLIDEKADISIKSDFGFTPAEEARELGESNMASLIESRSSALLKKLVSGSKIYFF